MVAAIHLRVVVTLSTRPLSRVAARVTFGADTIGTTMIQGERVIEAGLTPICRIVALTALTREVIGRCI